MKKVLHLMSTHAFSGAENVACQIINSFKNDKNYQMIYVSEILENEQNLKDRNINYYNLGKFNIKNVSKVIKDLNPDIIHAHDIRASIMAALFYKKCKIISHVHANHENMRTLNLKTFLYNIFSNKFSNIIWVSKSALDNYKYYSKVCNKSVVLYNVIDTVDITKKVEEDKNDYDFDIIYLGRLSYQKNPHRFIEIISHIVDKKKNLKVAIVGTGVFEQEIKDLVKEKKLDKNVTFFGFVNNPYKILSSSKIMLMTSRYEGTPMCALEAISLGIPIISTITDGLKEIVTNDKTGYLSNDNNVLIENVLYLLNNEEKYKNIRSNVVECNLMINDIKEYKYQIELLYK